MITLTESIVSGSGAMPWAASMRSCNGAVHDIKKSIVHAARAEGRCPRSRIPAWSRPTSCSPRLLIRIGARRIRSPCQRHWRSGRHRPASFLGDHNLLRQDGGEAQLDPLQEAR